MINKKWYCRSDRNEILSRLSIEFVCCNKIVKFEVLKICEIGNAKYEIMKFDVSKREKSWEKMDDKKIRTWIKYKSLSQCIDILIMILKDKELLVNIEVQYPRMLTL